MIAPEPSTATAFLNAVQRQLGAAGGEQPPTGEVESLLLGAQHLSDVERATVAQQLVDQPVLLSVLFQNVDLLYEHGHPGADALSLVIMKALEILDRRETET